MKSIVFASILVMLLGTFGCSGAQQPTTIGKDIVKLADDGCVLLHDVDPADAGTGQTICAKESELRPYIKLILGGRARPQVVDGGAN